ncbi:hypothetical protein WN51_08661 [Melipona quadrifasciata]|uniref:Uncharacterized protein n=1 Tax=Melipona quadrifasciata TaxID=166423 RepID=A0A0N0U6V4_9HYME|nr:hypothetical protein WN51_08661 [Melipona quadrifasciata]
MLWILIAVTCIELSTFANAQSKKTTSMQEDANNTEPDHPSLLYTLNDGASVPMNLPAANLVENRNPRIYAPGPWISFRNLDFRQLYQTEMAFTSLTSAHLGKRGEHIDTSGAVRRLMPANSARSARYERDQFPFLQTVRMSLVSATTSSMEDARSKFLSWISSNYAFLKEQQATGYTEPSGKRTGWMPLPIRVRCTPAYNGCDLCTNYDRLPPFMGALRRPPELTTFGEP